jgi:catechol 2,3-dioxygenase
MMNAPDVIRSAYAQLAVTDLGAARWFWVDMLGFYVQYEDADSLYLRGTTNSLTTPWCCAG